MNLAAFVLLGAGVVTVLSLIEGWDIAPFGAACYLAGGVVVSIWQWARR